MTRRWLLGRRFGRGPDCPVLLAPRGELGAGALSIRPLKKKVFLRLLRWTGMLRGIRYHATSTGEVTDITRELGADVPVMLAPNFASRHAPSIRPDRSAKEPGSVELAFCSRLVPKKNLGFLLGLLPQVRGRVKLRVIGPEEDAVYAARLRQMASALPATKSVEWVGTVAPDAIAAELGRSQFFVLPTLNENHGHVIVEAWQAGLPVLLSDQTPWHDLINSKSGWDMPLVPEPWIATLQDCVDMGEVTYGAWRAGALAAAGRLAANPPLNEWRVMLDWAARRAKSIR